MGVVRRATIAVLVTVVAALAVSACGSSSSSTGIDSSYVQSHLLKSLTDANVPKAKAQTAVNCITRHLKSDGLNSFSDMKKNETKVDSAVTGCASKLVGSGS